MNLANTSSEMPVQAIRHPAPLFDHLVGRGEQFAWKGFARACRLFCLKATPMRKKELSTGDRIVLAPFG